MLITEYRVILPMTVEEYQVAQLWSVAEASKNETGGGEGIEVVQNEPYDDPNKPLFDGQYTKGQYTYKIYHLANKVPRYVRMLAPKGSLEITEKAWNAYPYCRTVIENPEYMKENFYIKIETMHFQDDGNSYNIHKLSDENLQKRKIVTIDIANDPLENSSDYKESEDPSKFKSEKTGRGPLGKDWRKMENPPYPMMCCYKLVTCNFKWWGLQDRVEKLIIRAEKRIFTNFHRQVFCWMDKWYGLTMEDIRALEDKTKQELEKQLHEGELRGMTEK